jgi:ABC-type transport system involved in multi-copper enzyme maturation permease subunit
MNTALIRFLPRVFKPFRLTGPLLDKELRVSSRRARNYLLRFAYVSLLTTFVVIVWLTVVKFQGPAALQKSRMATAGKTIITTIVTFQFIATQMVAVIMLSTSISDEIYHRTLGLLMTTPISSLQIVLGKVLSKLLQLILLLAISLPLLAIVRIFGGVPLSYLLSSLCITLTAVIFAGSLSLHFSINNRRAYVVIIKTIFTLGVLYAFLPVIIGTFLTPVFLRVWPSLFVNMSLDYASLLAIAFLHLNPFAAISMNTTMMLSPVTRGVTPIFFWPAHCVLMLGLSALLLTRAVRIVRKVALRQATGQLELASKHRHRRKSKKPARETDSLKEVTGPIKPVKGSPVLWRELRAPTIQGPDQRNSFIGLAAIIIALLVIYAFCSRQKCLDSNFTQATFALLFVFLGSVFTVVRSATSITSEKESRTWPILLATSMNDWHILLGKALAVIRRSLPVWFLLLGHVVLFVTVRYIHPVAIVHLSMLVFWLLVFTTGAGLYFSSLFRRTTSAVVASFALAILLWIVTPSIVGSTSLIMGRDKAFRICASANPAIQAGVVMYGAAGEYNARTRLAELEYEWPIEILEIGPTTAILLKFTSLYVCAGLLFAWRAKCRFRRNVF